MFTSQNPLTSGLANRFLNLITWMLSFWATPHMSYVHLFFCIMCTGYILFGIQVEERTLIAEHGDNYRDYRRRVPMLLPLRRTEAPGSPQAATTSS